MGLTTDVEEGLTEAVLQDNAYSVTAIWVSLHSADPGSTGLHEITNGTGSEARQEGTFSGSAGENTNSGDLTFQVASANDCLWGGFWTAQTSGTFIGGFPLVAEQEVATAISGSPSIACPGHGRSIGDRVRLYVIPGSNSAVPTGFTADSVYYVVSVPDADHLTLSATSIGGAISPSSSGGFVLALDQSVNFPLGGELVMPATTGIVYATVS